MRITFVLPCDGGKPAGGFKVVYEYANRLAEGGCSVSIIHPAQGRTDLTLSGKLRKWIRYAQRRFDKSYLPTSWFDLNSRVDVRWAPSLHPRYIPEADAVIATGWATAEWVAEYPRQKGRKYYLIQHLETWAGPNERVLATWQLPLKKIVISRWLLDIAQEFGEDATYIPNGLDFAAFGVDTPPGGRESGRVAMLYHEAAWKGSVEGLTALQQVKEQVANLQVELFGVPSRPKDLPSWIQYYWSPPQCELRALYNRAAIFVAPSWVEGWGLPASEALMSGCALVATDVGGHREYAFDGATAALVPPKDVTRLGERIAELVHNQSLRLRLAKSGNEYIQQFTWERAVQRLMSVLNSEECC